MCTFFDIFSDRYCCCDAEILRENKLSVAAEKNDLTNFLCAAEQMLITETSNNLISLHFHQNAEIITNCMENIILNNCLDGNNRLRRPNNYLVVGESIFILIKM